MINLPKFICRSLVTASSRVSAMSQAKSRSFSDSALPLDLHVPTKDPLELCRLWVKDAHNHPEVVDHNAACLATADTDGRPSARMVMVTDISSKELKFHTSRETRKVHELVLNPQATLLFYWESLYRQIRIEGPVEQEKSEEPNPELVNYILLPDRFDFWWGLPNNRGKWGPHAKVVFHRLTDKRNKLDVPWKMEPVEISD